MCTYFLVRGWGNSEKDFFFFQSEPSNLRNARRSRPTLGNISQGILKTVQKLFFFLAFMVRFLKRVGPLTFFISSPMAKAFDSDFPYRYVRRRDFRLLTAQSVGNWEEEEEGRPRKMLSLWALGSCAGKKRLTGGFVTLDVFQH